VTHRLVQLQALNVEPCSGLHGPVLAQETKRLLGFPFPPGPIEVFRGLIRVEDVAQRTKL
jgi:hypothetical protein